MTDSWSEFIQRPWIIIGAGRLGRTLGLLGLELGIHVAGLWNRSESSAEETRQLFVDTTLQVSTGAPEAVLRGVSGPRVIWLTVVDDAIATVAERLAAQTVGGDIVVHSSGVASSDMLRDAGITDAHVGSIHVLQAITEPRRALESLHESTWSVEGDSEIVALARAMLGELGVEPLVLESEQKALYHASAVTTANLLVALMDAAFEMAEHAGMSRQQARDMLLPLARSSVENLGEQSTSEALSGPVARGDAATLEHHRRSLAELDSDELLRLYDVLTARAGGLVSDEGE